MALESGTRLGPYEVVEPIPAAAGERYKATDTRTNRLVAITVLPSGFAGRPDAKTRLEREARAISSLGDSDISGLIEIGHQDPSTDFVVAEFLEGETLAERIAAGPIGVSEAVGIGVAIARSLDQAHRQGVVHGGLTPSRILITSEGPKLLDFGIATLLDDSSIQPPGDASEAHRGGAAYPSMATTRSLHMPAAAPPNAAYMAPEQLAGAAPPEARTDIFAFGAILYEMLAGRPAFEEKTPALLVAAVQTVDPEPVSTLQPMAPAALDHVIARCLAKDPGQRIQTSRDLVRQLQWVAEGGSEVGVPVPITARRKMRERAIWGALAVGLVAAALLTPRVWDTFRAPPRPGAVRFALPLLPGPETAAPVSISPDGRWVARSTGGFGLGVQPLDSVNPELLGPNTTFVQPFWSPDSRSVAFFDQSDEGILKRIDVAGGPATTIVDAPQPVSPGGWNRDGVILFSSRGIIQRVPDTGGDATPVTALDETNGETEHCLPSFLPDGNHFLYTAGSADGAAIYAGALDSDQRTRLFEADSKALYADPGYILFNRGDALYAQPFDAGNLALTGEPLLVVDGLLTDTGGTNAGVTVNRCLGVTASFAASQTGVLAFVTARADGAGATAAPARTLQWRDRNGGVETVGPMAAYAGLDLHPDGSAVAVHVHEGTGGDISTFNFERGRPQGLTYDASQHNQSPVWSPDGERIAFVSQRNNQSGLYVKRADGTGPEELVFESGSQKTLTGWSPDGLLVYQEGAGGSVFAVGVEDGSDPFVVLEARSFIRFPAVSPAGGWLAYVSDESGDNQVYVQQFPEGLTKRQVSLEGGEAPRWRADGRELYYIGGGGIQAVELEIDGDSVEPGIPLLVASLPGNLNPGAGHQVSDHRFAPAPDGSRFLVTVAGGGDAGGGVDATFRTWADDASSLAGPAGEGEGVIVNVILNWPAILEER